MSGIDGPLTLVGRLVEASNATLLAQDASGARFCYKPVLGERPLADFPHHSLARREVAAYQLSEQAGFGVVPETVWVDDGPAGPGSAQRWIDADETLVSLVSVDDIPDDWFAFVIAEDEQGRDIALIHADTPELRRLAVFDAVANNADRKGGHILVADDGAVLGCDHGLTFHVEDKLRTVLLGWAGEPFTDVELGLIAAAGECADAISDWVSPHEVDTMIARCERLLTEGTFPLPAPGWKALPWPPL